MTDPTPCPFCEIAVGRAPAEILERWPGQALAITPLAPIVPGHELVIPDLHIEHAAADPAAAAETMYFAALRARAHEQDCNLITSIGPAATQTVQHLHVHVVPRRADDGLQLPWTTHQEATT